MRHKPVTKTLVALTIAAFAAVPVMAFNDGTGPHAVYDDIARNAATVQSEAREISQMLKGKSYDIGVVKQKLAAMEEHAAKVHQSLAQLQPSDDWSQEQRAEFDRLKSVAELMNIFIEDKRSNLEGDRAERKMLRAKADGIAIRAELVQKSALRLRG